MSEQQERQLRLAFIGCGGHSTKSLQPNARIVESIELVAMCDLDENKARRSADMWGVKASYTDYGKMLAQESPDAVAVVGPPSMMQPIAKDVLGRGVHVFMEKPPALTAESAKELVEASQTSGALGMVATHWRHAPAYDKARCLMADERFGEPTHCVGWFYAPGPRGDVWGARGVHGYLLAQGVHIVDCTRSLMGDVTEAFARAKHQDGAFESCAISMTFANGATGSLSLAAPGPYWTCHRVFGSAGAFVEVTDMKDLRCALPPFWTGQEGFDYANHSYQTWDCGPYFPASGCPGYREELTQFAECILAGKQPVASLDDGYQAMRVLEAIGQSCETGEAVAID